MYPLAVLSYVRLRFAYIVGHYEHARGQVGHQPAAAKTPFYILRLTIFLLLIAAFRDSQPKVTFLQCQNSTYRLHDSLRNSISWWNNACRYEERCRGGTKWLKNICDGEKKKKTRFCGQIMETKQWRMIKETKKREEIEGKGMIEVGMTRLPYHLGKAHTLRAGILYGLLRWLAVCPTAIFLDIYVGKLAALL